ncbi:hypothetical protein FDUTEX481_10043 [Tolypothrix sp. PCC 7601]|nr:hypothetical protein FDUTEX481_10043 [Tolypothrix sp. PCC 7601]
MQSQPDESWLNFILTLCSQYLSVKQIAALSIQLRQPIDESALWKILPKLKF